MKVIIQNDKNRLFARIDNCITARTKLNAESLVNDTALSLVNALDLSANDYLLIENIDFDRAEITQITSLSGNTANIISGLKFPHDDKTDVFKIDYNQIRFYEDDTILSTQTINPDYFQTYAYTVTESKKYSVSFVNSLTSKESTRGESIYGYEYQLCGVGDVSQFEPLDIIGQKIIDKIDIASKVIRAKITNQKQSFTDLTNRDVFRIPCALLSLHYYFFELIKNKDDIASLKAQMYLEKYDAEIARATDLINNTEDKVRMFGQAECIR